ncbi:heavy-metal-associated domain-containing protein [Flavobacterium sp.]|uniref:heavy-metal-associated domain-containing protein n=1 Tax=Flavobacterium sp. TaxID=239 RepID=UPI003D6AF603
MIHIIEVENIKCGGCMNSIKTALQKTETVTDIKIDKNTETITINAASERELLVKILSKLGYPEKGHNSILHKGKSFVSCAIGNLSK